MKNLNLKKLFMLDPSVIYLNHGSFGACPKPVFKVYQDWQTELERQPVLLLGRRADSLLDEARSELAIYLNTAVENIIFVPNSTVGINTVARTLKLNAGDEILTTNHEYGAMDKTWEFICQKTKAIYKRHPVLLPVKTSAELAESFWSEVTKRTKVIFLSHITSPTALRFPIESICQRARQAGILTVIDGAHAPGQIPINLDSLGADFYTGNCHKWLCAPKGSGFLYARPEQHQAFEPLIISWGWSESSSYVQKNQWQGTRDIAAYLSVPAAIEFQKKYDWESVRTHCHELVLYARNLMKEVTGLESICPDSREWFVQMSVLPLPVCDGEKLKKHLYDEFQIEIPYINWNGYYFLRISVQCYTTKEDIETFVSAVAKLLPKVVEKK